MISRRNGGQRKGLAHTQLALLEDRVEVRRHVTDQGHVTDGHQQGQQQEPQA